MVQPKLHVVSNIPEEVTQPHPLVFIHGMFQGSWVWEENYLDYFASKGFACYAINLRGHNGSDHDGSFRFISIGDYVKDLSSVVSSLDQPPILIGHSMGGFIIQKYLEQNQVPLAILLASVPPKAGVFRPTLKVMARHPFRFLWGNLTLSLKPIANHQPLVMHLMFGPSIDLKFTEKYYPKHQNESYRAYLDMLFLTRARPKKITSDIEFLGFEHDNSISAAMVEKTAASYNKQAKIFQGFGHTPMIEPGWEEVAEYILDLLGNRA